MPIYDYECKNGHVVEELRSVNARHDDLVCPQCEEAMTLVVGAPHFGVLAMGCDSGFPTFYDKWAKLQRAKNTGKQWDSNNNRYGGDWEKK